MNIITGLIFLFLFLIIMIVVFSMGLISPYIGKKEMTYIVIIGFVLGGLGGYFFLEPIYEETPYISGTLYELFSTEDDYVNLILPSTSNVSKVSSDILKVDGVNSVTTNGFDLKTDNFTDVQKGNIEDHLKTSKDIKSYKVNESFISVNLSENSHSTTTLGNLVSWLNNNSISSEFAFIHLQVKIKHSYTNSVEQYMKDEHYNIDSIEGPVQDVIKNSSDKLLSKWIVVLISGFIGVIFAVCGLYFDSLQSIFKRKEKI